MNNNQNSIYLVVNVDGVLTSARTYFVKRNRMESSDEPTDKLDPVALHLLETFARELNTQVVMATAWASFIPTADAWRQTFADKGFDIPVVDVLKRPERSWDWYEAMLTYMGDRPNANYVLFDDDPEKPEQERLITVDARVGLTVANLHTAAQLLAPNARITKRLADCNESFGPEKSITVIANGQIFKGHPRDIVNQMLPNS